MSADCWRPTETYSTLQPFIIPTRDSNQSYSSIKVSVDCASASQQRDAYFADQSEDVDSEIIPSSCSWQQLIDGDDDGPPKTNTTQSLHCSDAGLLSFPASLPSCIIELFVISVKRTLFIFFQTSRSQQNHGDTNSIARGTPSAARAVFIIASSVAHWFRYMSSNLVSEVSARLFAANTQLRTL